MATIGNLTPFPYTLSPLNNITPFSYKDGATYLEILENLSTYMTTLVPSMDVELTGIIADFQAGIVNAENTITAMQAAWQTTYDAAVADIGVSKTQWQTLFDSFMVDVTNQIAVLNQNAVSQIINTLFPNIAGYNVPNDGVTDATSTFTAALNSATALGQPLHLPVGKYLLDNIIVPENASIIGSGPGTVIIQKDPARPVFRFDGSQSLLGSLTETLVKGATTINVLQSWNLVNGDLVMINDTVSYAGTDAGYKSGEQFMVASSTATGVTLSSPVRGSFSNVDESYTVANSSSVRKIVPIKNIEIRDMSFIGHAAGTASIIAATYAMNVNLIGLTVSFANSSFTTLTSCRNVDVSNFNIVKIVDNLVNGHPGYAFAIIESCYNVSIHDGINTDCRHIVTTIGGAYGIPRLLTFGPNIVSSGPNNVAHLDTHSAAEGVHIHGNVLNGGQGGVTNRGRNIVVENNDISNITAGAILVNEDGQNIVIKNNRIRKSVLGIRVGAGGSINSNVEISGNAVIDSLGDAISTQTGSTDIRIINNLVQNSVSHAIIVGSGANKIVVSKNNVSDITGNGVLVGGPGTDIIVDSNLIRRVSRIGIEVPVTCVDVMISNNTIIDASTIGVSPGISCSGVQGSGSFNFMGNQIKQEISNMNRAIYTTATKGRIVSNISLGPFTSAGSEFYGGAGMLNTDNKVYA